jgi:hypothetical protein
MKAEYIEGRKAREKFERQGVNQRPSEMTAKLQHLGVGGVK